MTYYPGKMSPYNVGMSSSQMAPCKPLPKPPATVRVHAQQEEETLEARLVTISFNKTLTTGYL